MKYRELFTKKRYKNLRRVVWTQTFLTWTLPYYVVGVGILIEKMSLPSIQLGISLTAVVAGCTFGHNFSSLLNSHFESKKVLVVSMPILLTCNASFLLAQKSYLLLTMLLLTLGVLFGVNFTSTNVIYRELLPNNPDERQLIKSKFAPLPNLTAGFSGIVVTQLVGQFGWNIPDLLFGLLATTMVFRVQAPKVKTVTEGRVRIPLSLRWKLTVIGMPILIVSLISRIYTIYFPSHSGEKSGILLFAYYLANGFTADLITRIAIRHSRKKVIYGSLLLIGIDCILLSQVTHFLLLLLVAILSGFAARGILICLNTEMEIYAESRYNKTAAVVSSTFQTMTNVGQLGGGFIAGYISANPNLWFLVLPVVGFILISGKEKRNPAN